MANISKIVVNSVEFDVTDAAVRLQIENKLDNPTDGKAGQALIKTEDGYAWQDIETGSNYIAGNGIEIKDDIINCTITVGEGLIKAGNTFSVNFSEIARAEHSHTNYITSQEANTSYAAAVHNHKLADIEDFDGSLIGNTYTAGNGIDITGNVISCTVTAIQGEKGEKGDKGDKGDPGEKGEPGESLSYTAGDGINISNDIVSVDFDAVAKKSDIVIFKEGTGIDIAVDGTISCTISEGQPYYDGNGIDITADNKINIKGVPYFDHEPEDTVGLYMNSEGLKFAGESDLVTATIMTQELAQYITTETFNNTIGSLNDILDEINGEVI